MMTQFLSYQTLISANQLKVARRQCPCLYPLECIDTMSMRSLTWPRSWHWPLTLCNQGHLNTRQLLWGGFFFCGFLLLQFPRFPFFFFVMHPSITYLVLVRWHEHIRKTEDCQCASRTNCTRLSLPTIIVNLWMLSNIMTETWLPTRPSLRPSWIYSKIFEPMTLQLRHKYFPVDLVDYVLSDTPLLRSP